MNLKTCRFHHLLEVIMFALLSCLAFTHSSPVDEDFSNLIHLSHLHNTNNDHHQLKHSDAPKYYDLNALLYKAQQDANKNHQPDANAGTHLRPLDNESTLMSRREASREAINDRDEESSIDSLIGSMRRAKDSEGSSMAGKGPLDATAAADRDQLDDDDDQATVQRKSTRLDEADEESSSRLRVEPRRKRRANTRQAPPKLKSRRVSRYSKKRKLRHGIKPKRRA